MNCPPPYSHLVNLTVWEQLENVAARLPNKVAFIKGETRMTFGDLLQQSGKIANGLSALRLGKGDMAAVFIPNSIELVVAFYAFQKLGVGVVWINPMYRENEAFFLLKDSQAKAVLCFEQWNGFEYQKALETLQPELPELEHIIVADSCSGVCTDNPALRVFTDLAIEKGPASGEQTQDLKADDLSMMLYTSGTTGEPKGAMIGQSQVLRAGLSYSLVVDAVEDDIILGFLSMAHSYGCGALLVQPVVIGATVVIMDNFGPTKAFELIQKEGVTLQPGAPAHYLMELNAPDRKDYDLSSLRAGMIAGQIAPGGLIRRVEEEMGVYISSFLGSSEVGPGNSILLPYQSSMEERETSIGRPIPGTEVKIIDPATGMEMPDDEEGELLLSGWHVMKGYWNKERETRKQLKDGWLHTGDLAARDKKGNIRILGRLKEWINRGGFKIIPSELEMLVIEHPNVAEVCVVNTPNPILGESICVCVKLEDTTKSLTLAEVRIYLEGKVAKFKLPDELLILEEFPRMPGGLKVNRFGKGGVIELATNDPTKQFLHTSEAPNFGLLPEMGVKYL